jgi:hypothetical protein
MFKQKNHSPKDFDHVAANKPSKLQPLIYIHVLLDPR